MASQASVIALLSILVTVVRVRGDRSITETSAVCTGNSDLELLRADGNLKKLFGFRPSHRSRIIIGLDVHFVSQDSRELEPSWVNFSRSRLQSDWESLAGIKFSLTNISSYVAQYGDGGTANQTSADIDRSSSAIWEASVGHELYCKLGVGDGINNFTIGPGEYQPYRDPSCVQGVADSTGHDICSTKKTGPLNITSQLGCNGINPYNSIHGYPLDMFEYRLGGANPAGVIHVQLVTVGSNSELVFASGNKAGRYILEKEQEYAIYFYNNGTERVTIQFSFHFSKHNCIFEEEYVQRWIDSDAIKQDRIHLILSSRIQPTYNYKTFPEVGLILKYYDPQTFWHGNSTDLWLSMMKVLGGTLTPELCEGVATGRGLPLAKDTEMLRCQAVNAAQPFARRTNSTRIKLEFLFEDTHKMIYIPPTVDHGDVLCCANITKVCIWGECPVIPKRPAIAPTPSKITYFPIIFIFKDTVKVTVDLPKISYWLHEVAEITEPVTNLCKKEHAIKLTIGASNVNSISKKIGSLDKKLTNGQLSYDGMKICYREIVASYDCDKIEDHMCPQRDANKIQTWHIVSLVVTIIEIIVLIILSCFIYFRVWKKRARPMRRLPPKQD